ncbi:TniQ family protein [Roseateles sp. BYS78W]|uniref:TniQ family protein n=1 Tax=Pelomonas candidula TaxID=3299025 RepID=A0ABW7HDE8_9BURK
MLAISAPLPDELSRSFLGRLMRMNGVAGEKDMIERLASFLGVAERDRRKVTVTELLSMAARMGPENFVCQHTLIPLRRSITSYLPDLAHGAPGSQGVLFLSGQRLIRPIPYLCADCVRADVDRFGISYWHREHQLPGVLWCARHRTPLRYADAEDALLWPTSQWVGDSREVGAEWFNELNEHKVVRRFHAIIDGLMDTHRPYPVPHVSARLRQKARAHGLLTYSSSKPPRGARLLSDVVRDGFPHDWLSTVFPELVAKAPEAQLVQMDGVLYLPNSSAPATVYALACSVLYDSADEALTDIATGMQQGMVIASGGRRSKVSDEVYRSAYLVHGGVYREVARQISVTPQSAAKRLQQLGLPDLKERGWGPIRRALFAFFVSGMRLEEAARIGGISAETLEAAIRQAGAGFVGVLREMDATTSCRSAGKPRVQPLSPHQAKSASESWQVIASLSGATKRSCKSGIEG